MSEVDPEIAEELERQQRTLEMIGSENLGPATLECHASLPAVEIAEQLAVDRACRLFGAERANVRPHSATQANAAVYHALLEPGETILALDLGHGGHLMPGTSVDISGSLYEIATYHVDRATSLVDMDEVEADRARAPAAVDPGRLVGLPPGPRLPSLPRDRRRGRRVPAGRYVALRRAGRGGPASESGAVRGRRHDHDLQDARRYSRRDDPVDRAARRDDCRPCPRRSRERCPRARDRRQGRDPRPRRVGLLP